MKESSYILSSGSGGVQLHPVSWLGELSGIGPKNEGLDNIETSHTALVIVTYWL